MVHSSLNQQKDQLILSDIEDPDPSDSIIEDQPVTFDIVEDGTNRRASKLVSSDGYSYTVKKSGARTTNWRCCVRNKSVWCKATVIQKGNQFIPGSNPQAHSSDPCLIKKTKIKAQAIREASVHVYKSAGDIVQDAMDQVIGHNDFNLPNPTYVERSVNRFRQMLRPAEPIDLSFEIDTDFLNCEDFLVGDVIIGTQLHIMFATQQQLDLLKNARRWYLDGGTEVPLCFVLMSSRQKKDYTAVFSRLVQLIPDNRVQAFCLDFESGAWAAIKAVFPDTEIKGCAFHWGQAVMWKVANLGLKSSYNAKKAVDQLPYQHMAQQPNMEWSVFRQTVRTNNDVEGWHHRFIGKAGGSNLHFYKLVPALMKEARSVGVAVRLVEEQSLRRYQRVTFRKSQGRLAELWDKYEAKTIKTSDFLRSVGNIYATIVPTSQDSVSES